MTEYRSISNGRWEYLQYLCEEKSFFGLRTKMVWRYVPRPNRWRYEGGYEPSMDELYVSSLDFNLTRFIEKWKSINDYLEHYRKEQKEIVAAITSDDERVNAKKGIIKSLN